MKRSIDEKFMRMAVDKARQGMTSGQTPFGACIVKKGRVIGCGHNAVWKKKDITAHAEIHAIRHACQKMKTVDLSECTLYSTCEPCPMCFSACHWAKISRIVYGARIRDAAKAGFNELPISNIHMKRAGRSSIVIVGDFLRGECLQLFKDWSKRKNKKVY